MPMFELYDNAQRYCNVAASVPHIVSRIHLPCPDMFAKNEGSYFTKLC